MLKIRFTKEHLIKDEHRGTDKETRYHVGDVISVSRASADHFLNRRVAEIVPVQKRKSAEKPALAADDSTLVVKDEIRTKV